jgi:glycosyltransferase involved in cell wall biosynthesis
LCPSGTLFENGKLFTASLNGKFPWEAIRKKVYRHSALQTFFLACTVWLHRQLGTWKKIDRYICLSPFQRSLILDTKLGIGSPQVSVKTNFVTGISAGKITNRKGQRLLFAGRLSEEKGLQVLLEFIPHLRQPLEIIGSGPMENEIKEAAESNPLVTYSGFRDRDYIIHALQHAQVLLFPSLWYEGMPMILAESFAAATPVIASRLGAMPGIINENKNGFLFNAGNAAELEAAVTRWNQLDETARSAMRREARSAYESYHTPERNLEALLDIYEDLIPQK